MLLSFDEEQILMWRGHDWKSMYKRAPMTLSPVRDMTVNGMNRSGMHKIMANEGSEFARYFSDGHYKSHISK